MRRMLPALVLGLLLAPAAATAATQPKAGTYEVGYLTPTVGPIACLVKITPKDDGVTGELVAATAGLRGLELKSATLDGDMLKIALKGPSGDMSFEGRVTKAGADTILGTFEMSGRLLMGRVAFTDKTELTAQNSTYRPEVPEPMQKVQTLTAKVVDLRQRAAKSKAPEEKSKLTKDAADADQETKAAMPKLYREVVEQHPTSLAVETAATYLIRQAEKDKVDPAQVRGWAAALLKLAQPHGPRYEGEVTTRVAELLAPQAPYATLAVEYARQAEKNLTAKDSLDQQVRVIGTLTTALKNAGVAAEAAATETRLVKLETELDREYLATVPPFKPTPFTGRKEKSDRAVVMELFTGAQCPPCVAADVAFDALEKTYKGSEVVLIQYHLHIPGPDPMTNAATEARAKYYGANSTPTVLFNGKNVSALDPNVRGGGNMAMAQERYGQYSQIINKLVDEQAGAAVKLDARRQGDVVTLHADVSKVPDPGADKKLRFLLVEETIRFVGSNKLRFHHMVVRAMPAGPDGIALTKADGQHTATLNLADLRQELTKYLDDYAANKSPFPQPGRPLDFKGLKAIALVQDDKTKDILQAVVVNFGGDHAQP